MAAGRVKLTLVIITVVLLIGTPCFGSCAPAHTSDDHLPPCHRHHQAPTHETSAAACCHDFLPSGASQSPAMVAVPAARPQLPVTTFAVTSPVLTTPDPAPPPSTFLRI
jgi:hypothetical protein